MLPYDVPKVNRLLHDQTVPFFLEGVIILRVPDQILRAVLFPFQNLDHFGKIADTEYSGVATIGRLKG